MALGPSVPTTAFVVVYNPSQYINSITNGETAEQIEALSQLLECITHSDIDLITLGSIWLCVTGLLTNEEQQKVINPEIRSSALKCVLELMKIDQLHRRFFHIWLSFDFLARYKFDQEFDAGLWLKCFQALTEGRNRMDLIDDRLRARLLIQFINGILTGPLSRNTDAYQTLKDLLTNNCHLRYDELTLILENIFRFLNRDEDETTITTTTTNINPRSPHQQPIKKSIEFLHWLIDHQPMNTTLLHYFIQNIVDLHDKNTLSTGVNKELLQLITHHLAKAPLYNISVISVLCGIIVERLETPINNELDPLSTLLFVLTQTLIDIRQSRSYKEHQIQLSKDDIIHRRCFLNTIQQLPLCWLTILHQVLIKRENVNIILINLQQFLTNINLNNCTCALNLFDMTIWKMMDEILKISYQYIMNDSKSPASTRMKYEECLNIFEEFANKLCCLPHTMSQHLFDIKRLTSIPKTNLREQMIKRSSNELLRLIRPNNPDWSVTLRELIEHILLNANEPVTTRMEVFTTIFDKYLWFKMTDQVTHIGEIILDALENLIHIDLNSLTEDEFVGKHASMKQNAVKSIFEHFLSDHSLDVNLGNHCYTILQAIYEQDCVHISSIESIHRPLIELILEQMINLFEIHLTCTRLTSFNHCTIILNFFLRLFSGNYSKIIQCLQVKIRLLIWQLFFNIRVRTSDGYLGMISNKSDLINYGIYRTDIDSRSLIENEKSLDLHGYLSNIVEWIRMESPVVINAILGYLHNYLKEPLLTNLSGIHINQLIPLFIEKFEEDLMNDVESSMALNCLVVCTYYKDRIENINEILDCFLKAMNCSKTLMVITSIQALILSLVNLTDEINVYIPRIISNLMKKTHSDVYGSQIVLEFLMHFLFGNFDDHSRTTDIFQILLNIIQQCQYQTAHNLLLAHTLVCFYFNQLTDDQRQEYAYFLIRSLQQTSTSSRELDSMSIERPNRLQRSGSLSSLNDDTHSNDLSKRKMTVLDSGPPPPLPPSSTNNEDNNPYKKLNDELTRITINYINDHFNLSHLPETIFILLPREVRRHHVHHSWLADEQLLYQIKPLYEFNQLSRAKDFLGKFTHEFDDTMTSRHRRYTDGNRQNVRRNRDLQILTTCQDDLHIRPLELDTNQSMFNERNLWITVVVRSLTSTKKCLAINLSASSGIPHTKNEKLHWFEAVKLSDTSVKKSGLVEHFPDYCQDERSDYSLNRSALKAEFQSIITNIDRKDEESLLNRHNENYFPQKLRRVPPEAQKSIESFDHVDPVRIAKIGVVCIQSKQEMTEANILSNIQPTQRYQQFMSSLAILKSIKSLQDENFYCPLLDANNPENCGQYAYIWHNSIYQVLFHTSTLLPNTRIDHEFKKKLIGNDYVIIVYNENDQPLDMKTLKTGVCQYVIEVCPQMNSNYTRVRLKRRMNATPRSPNAPKMESISLHEIDHLISDDHLGSYVRTLALCLCQQGELETRQRSPSHLSFFISPWQDRLQALRSLHTRCSLSYNNRK